MSLFQYVILYPEYLNELALVAPQGNVTHNHYPPGWNCVQLAWT
jgi:hypothetical protein